MYPISISTVHFAIHRSHIALFLYCCSGMSFQLSSVNARDWFQKRREGVQPWAEFLSVQRLKAPTSLAATGKRIVANVEKFQSNYLFVFLGLVVFCM